MKMIYNLQTKREKEMKLDWSCLVYLFLRWMIEKNYEVEVENGSVKERRRERCLRL